MIDSSSNYVFNTYGIGVIVKPSIIDRDDFLRSKYKLKGIDSVKNRHYKRIDKNFLQKKTKKIIEFS